LRAELGRTEPDEPRHAQLARELEQLTQLSTFAFPILELLEHLPEGGTWGDWLRALEQLARQSLREPEGVCEVLLELAPLAPVGPVYLADVERLLARRLGSMIVRSTGSAAGKLFVGAVEDLRGRAFDVVFVLGLAEKVFPPRVLEDPLLTDEARRALGPNLMLTEERVAHERLLLRLAVGAARSAVVLTFPRFDVEHGRPRVPSFYGLEVLQAVDGELPAFDELYRRADLGAAARMGWPAPANPALSIDDAEYDLSVLDQWRAQAGEKTGGTRYSLLSNPHLARALRFRARRWEIARFNEADGLVLSPEAVPALLADQQLSARDYSATALSLVAACPYRFFLHAIVGLAERERVAELDELDERGRGVLFHGIQREFLRQAKLRGMLPITRDNLGQAEALLEEVFGTEVARVREELAPASERVFELSLNTARTDLRQWIALMAQERSWVPVHFELGFGLSPSDQRDPESRLEAVQLAEGLRLRGAIDLVEQGAHPGPDGRPLVRATDHKTGSAELKASAITAGARVLQPLLYALALERLFEGARVDSGRLYFCTTRAGFASHEVPLHAGARRVAAEFVQCVDALLGQGFLPAAPAHTRELGPECERCSFRVVCGPYEAERVARVKAKDFARLKPLFQLRNLP
jgi:ATP-dependent helicase/nuclease subunit B